MLLEKNLRGPTEHFTVSRQETFFVYRINTLVALLYLILVNVH